jgi:hypothetical protein
MREGAAWPREFDPASIAAAVSNSLTECNPQRIPPLAEADIH